MATRTTPLTAEQAVGLASMPASPPPERSELAPKPEKEETTTSVAITPILSVAARTVARLRAKEEAAARQAVMAATSAEEPSETESEAPDPGVSHLSCAPGSPRPTSRVRRRPPSSR